MKISKIFVFLILLVPLMLYQFCGQGPGSLGQNTGELKYLNTVYGGCNNTNRANISDFIPEFKNDTVYYSSSGDTLKISIGLNYICCAPFVVQQYQEDQNLFITLKDTCNLARGICYCRCMCYYDFDVYFSDYNHRAYFLKVYLHDPRQPADSLIHDIVIK
jgi:hypothetical protein